MTKLEIGLLYFFSSALIFTMTSVYLIQKYTYKNTSTLQTNQSITSPKEQVLVKNIDEKIKPPKAPTSKTNIFTPTLKETFKITDLLTGIVKVDCKDSQGSGSLWKLSDGTFAVLTNKHVVSSPYFRDGRQICNITPEALNGDTLGLYDIDIDSDYFESTPLDIALLPIKGMTDFSAPESLINSFKPFNELNYKISTLKKCVENTPIGSTVLIIGYPLSGQKLVEYKGVSLNQKIRITTEGIVSGHDNLISDIVGHGAHPDYVTSAKVDSGNSGGIAFSKENDSYCVLGVPTWVINGRYSSQGIIQNIRNIPLP